MDRRAYRIKDWDEHFETSESRKRVKPLTWVAIPTRHDGKGYRRLLREHGLGVYGAWILIVAVAAKCPTRGTLADADGPLCAMDIADKTDCPVAVIEQTLKALSDKRIGWIEFTDLPVSQQKPRQSAATASYRTGPDKTKPDQTGPPAGTGVSTKREEEQDWGPSAFTGLSREHLTQCEVLDRWFAWATSEAKSPLCRRSGGHSEQNRLRVFGAAERAIEESEDPIKLFKHIVGGEKWRLITQAQEARAMQRLKALERTQ